MTKSIYINDTIQPRILRKTHQKLSIQGQIRAAKRTVTPQLDAFYDAMIAKRVKELENIKNIKNFYRNGIQPYEWPHAVAYIFLCRRLEAPIRDFIEVDDLNREYRPAQETLVEACRETPYRGNLIPDIEETNHECSRSVCIVREIQTKFFHGSTIPISAAVAALMEAGNCAENSDLTAVIHGKKMQEGNKLRIVSHSTIDHAFTLFKGQLKLVIDAWAFGPCVLTKHSSFAKREDRMKIDATYDHQTGQALYDEFVALTEEIAQDKKIQGYSVRRLAELEACDYKFPKDKTWRETPVLDESCFFTPVVTLMKKIQDFPEEEGLQRIFESKFPPYPDQDYLNDIVATGVARDFGECIRQAVKKADNIVKAAKNLVETRGINLD